MAMLKKNNLKIILNYYKKYLFLYIGFLVIIIINAVISFFGAMLTAKLITNIMSYNFDKVRSIAFIYLLIFVFHHILDCIKTFFYKNLENYVRFDLQQDIISSSLNIKMSYYDNVGSGIILTRLTSDIDHLSERFKSITEKIVNIIRRFVYLGYIFILNFKIGLLVFASVLAVFLAYSIRIYFFEKLKPVVKTKREAVNSKIIETVRAVKDIKTLNCDKNILDIIGEAQKEFIKKDNIEYYIGISLCNLKNIVVEISNFLFVLIGCNLIINGDVTLAIFYTCFLYKDHVYSFASEFGDLRYKFAECRICADRLVPLLYPKEEAMDNYGKSSITHFDGSVEFKNVNFSYIDGVEVINNMSFKIPSKKTIALVGESGSGKTSIASLIGHLYYKESGSITFDGVEIEKLNKDFIRNNVVTVNQFPYLFNLSIKENFLIIKPDISDEEIYAMLKKVKMYDYVINLPNKIDSIIGEGGCQLSGGQKQKLCIARALTKKAKILIFDEATSSLDNNSQSEIMDIIKCLKEQVTIIIIAHRLSTITYADSIILIKDGKVDAIESHENLLKNNKYYQNLYHQDLLI